MISETQDSPGLARLLRKTCSTAMGAFQNRAELFLVELEEEKSRLVTMIFCGLGAVFLGMAALLLLTGTVIFLFPQEYRVYAAGGFTLLYVAATIWAVLRMKALLKAVPFSETTGQLKKDQEILEAFSE